MSFPGNASWLEVDAGALRNNIAVFRKLLAPGTSETPGSTPAPKLGAVLKANAYGHGFLEVLSIIHPLVDVLYVITPQDALLARAWERETGKALPQRQILVMGATTAEEAVALARENVDVTIGDSEWTAAAPLLRAAGLRARCHIHVDTGLGREGFSPRDIPSKLAFLKADADVFDVVGLFSHFANTEDVTEQAYALEQLRVFEEGIDVARRTLPLSRSLERHTAASAAALVLPQSRLNAVRVGISLYGLWPSSETRISAKIILQEIPKLQPVLSWHCRSQVVKTVPAGSFVGYGCTYRCSRETKVAVFPVGYFDGYPRLLSSRAHVLVNGVRCPVIGRVMMNHIVVDITGAVPGEGMPSDGPVMATLLGQCEPRGDQGECLTAENLATWAQTIHYELVARLGSHLKRVITNP